MIRRMVLTWGTLALAATALGQARPQAPRPGPEIQQLGYFVGDWKTDGEMLPLPPYVPGGKFTSTDHGEWLDGGFFVLIRANSSSPVGAGMQITVLGWDPAQKVYTFNSFNNVGVRTSATGTFDGTTWVWSGSETVQGFRSRHTIAVTSPTAYSYKFETSRDGQTWTIFSTGNVSKVR